MIYLASASPRRQELLRQIGLAFEAVPSGIHEAPRPGETPEQYVLRAATDKARTVAHRVAESGRPERPVLGADTEVVLAGEVLCKPRDLPHARAMLRRLADRSHEVLTAIVLLHAGREYSALSASRVTFGPLDDAEIARYWETGEPADKAGGYAVQGRAAAFIRHIEGSYSGIMGLPLHELAQLLWQAGIEQP